MERLNPSFQAPLLQHNDTQTHAEGFESELLTVFLTALEEAKRLPPMPWFIQFCKGQGLNRNESFFVLSYLNALIDSEGYPWALNAEGSDLLQQASNAAAIAKDTNHDYILVMLSDILAYYPLQVNGLANFIEDFQRLLAPNTRPYPQHLVDQPQRLAIALAIVQTNFFRETPITQKELAEIHAMDLERFNCDNLTGISLPRFWQKHKDCAHLFHNILRRHPDPFIAAQDRSLVKMSKEISTTLLKAALEGDANLVKAMLRIPTLHVNGQSDQHALTAIWAASQSGSLECIRQLLQDPRTDVNLTSNGGVTPFAVACVNEHLEAINILLQHPRVDVNHPIESSGSTPFHIACCEGYVSVVQLLLSNPRVNINKLNGEGFSPFFMVCTKFMRRLSHSTQLNNFNATPIPSQEQANSLAIIKALLGDPRTDVNRPTKEGVSPFFLACSNEDLLLMGLLLRDQRTKINQTTADGRTPLLLACLTGNVTIVKKLLEHPNIQLEQPQGGLTPLIAACKSGHTEVVRLLLDDGRIDINQEPLHGVTALLEACNYQHLEIVKLLQKAPRHDVNRLLNSGYTPLEEACRNGNDQTMQLLLDDPRLDFSPHRQERALDCLLRAPTRTVVAIRLFVQYIQLPQTFLDKLGTSLANDVTTNQQMRNLYMDQKIFLTDIATSTVPSHSQNLFQELIYRSDGSLHLIRSLRHMFLQASDPSSKLQPGQWTNKSGNSEYDPVWDLVPGGLRLRFSAQSYKTGLIDNLIARLQMHDIMTTLQSPSRIYIQQDGTLYTHELIIFSEKLPALGTLFKLDREITLDDRSTTLYQELFLTNEATAILDTRVQHRLSLTDEGTYQPDTCNAIASTLCACVPETRAQLAAFHASLDAHLSNDVLNDPLTLARARAIRQPEQSMPFPWIEFDLFGMWIRLPEDMCTNKSHGIHGILKEVFRLTPLPTDLVHPTHGKRYTMQYLVPRNDIPRTMNALGIGNQSSIIDGHLYYIDYIRNLAHAEDDSIPCYHEYEAVWTNNPYMTINQSLQEVIFHKSEILPLTSMRGRNGSLRIAIKEIAKEEDRVFARLLTHYLGYPCSYFNDGTSCAITVPANQIESFLRDKLKLDDLDGGLSILEELRATHPLIKFRPIFRHKTGKDKDRLDASATLAWSLATLMPETAEKICGLDLHAPIPKGVVLPTVRIQGAHTVITIPETLTVPRATGNRSMIEYLSTLLKVPCEENCLKLDSGKMHELLETHLGLIRLPLRYQNENRKRFHHLYFDAQPGSMNDAGITITQPSVNLPKNLPKYTKEQMIEILRNILQDHPRAEQWISVFLHTYQMSEEGKVQSAKQHIKEWLPAILNKLKDPMIPHHKKTSLINDIGETCGPNLCENARGSKLYFQYQQLVLPNGFDEVFSTILSTIAEFKEHLIAQVISEDPNVPQQNNAHVLSAFYKKFHRVCGLDPNASQFDADTKKYGAHWVTTDQKDKFLKNYHKQRNELVQWVIDRVNTTRLHYPLKPAWTQSIALAEAIQEKFELIFDNMDQDERTECLSYLLSSKRQRMASLVGEDELETVVADCLQGDQTSLHQALKTKHHRPEQIPALIKELMPRVDDEGHNDLDACVLTTEGAIELLIALGVLNA